MAAFPAYGQLLLDGHGETPESALLRTDMEGGPPKQIKIKSRVMVARPVAYLFSATEYSQFKIWHRDTINRGADWFDWVEPVDGTTVQARIVGGAYTARAERGTPGAELTFRVDLTLESWDA